MIVYIPKHLVSSYDNGDEITAFTLPEISRKYPPEELEAVDVPKEWTYIKWHNGTVQVKKNGFGNQEKVDWTRY